MALEACAHAPPVTSWLQIGFVVVVWSAATGCRCARVRRVRLDVQPASQPASARPFAPAAIDAALASLARRPVRQGAPAVGWFLGFGAGLTVPGRQDLKLKKHSERGVLTNYLFSRNVDADDAPMVSVYGGCWGPGAWGLQLDVSYWHTATEPMHFENRGPVATAHERPPFAAIGQHRVACYLSPLFRVPFPGARRLEPSRPFLYAGAGLGLIYTKVDYGHTGWNWAYQLLGGAAVPLRRNNRLRLEMRFTVAPDADSPVRAQWRADTSGVGMFPGFAHKDTRFFAILLAYETQF